MQCIAIKSLPYLITCAVHDMYVMYMSMNVCKMYVCHVYVYDEYMYEV